MRCLPVALLPLAIASSEAFAQSGPTAAQTAPGPAAGQTDEDDEEIVVEGELPDAKRRICEMRTTTGSIMPKRVCRSVAQIEQERRAAQESIERSNRDREARDTIQLNRDAGV